MPSLPSFATIAIGDKLPGLTKPAIDRVQLALYAGASGDHNDIHLDDERAKAGGLPGVIAHGMLSMAFLGELVASWVPITAIRSLGGRFAAITRPGDVIACVGVVAAKSTFEGENRIEVDLTAESVTGEKTIVGKAFIAIP
ncbi:MAG: dehydratase [Alphaproteobacteria bacterium]|nr:dehydratase [Alphaproteobacteria bacterium]